MRLSSALSTVRQRLIDALGGGARFGGGGGTAVALVAWDGRLVKLSETGARMFALADRARSLADLFLADDQVAVSHALRSKTISRVEARARRPGGAEGFFEIAIERRPDGYAAALLIDRTAEKRVQRRLLQDVDRARAEAADGAVMLADLSHEMRTPLNAVIGFAETIERQTFGPVGHENYAQYADHIRMAGRHLLDLVNTVLDLSKVEADRFALNRVAVDPASIARECSAMMSQQAADAGLQLVVDIAGDLPESYLDPRAVRQILLNLLANAIKFTADGEIRLTVRREGDEVVFAVKDDGVGMSAEALQMIGARFTAAHGTGVRGQGGAGLGLSLAISLAELHGGRVKIHSAPGEGLNAQVFLPIVARPAPAKGAVRAVMAAAARNGGDADVVTATVTQLDRIKAYRRLKPTKADAA